ncbi:MAG: hypothetical protein DRR06_06170 [Gammaproteobacteria bacterium]|nr:MAG: hypothetical protein DRR06_06170 [Gammaproteobacteria bacterium]RLA49989.1 MAG: hypothetical protein DRR42_14355 [Gammaproteobacteria bacterium]
MLFSNQIHKRVQQLALTDKRRGGEPVPNNLDKNLTRLQRFSLRRLAGFGWGIHFVRRPLFQDPIIVMRNKNSNHIGVLKDNGVINREHGIQIRSRDIKFTTSTHPRLKTKKQFLSGTLSSH